MPPRPTNGHKGTFGRVLIIGGSRDMPGAPVLAGLAALRMGSGLVQVAMPRAMLSGALSFAPELIGLGLTKDGDGEKSDRGKLKTAIASADVVVIGCGMGVSRDSHDRLRTVLKGKTPVVIDADALNVLAIGKRWPSEMPSAVLTPHPGEMKRLAKFVGESEVPTHNTGRLALAIAFAEMSGQVVVLKGHRTVVVDGVAGGSADGEASRDAYVNTTGDDSLGKAGTGDVLAGMIASLIGQGMQRFEAASVGVYLHGLAGEIAGRKFGTRSVLARDVIDSISDAIALATGDSTRAGEIAFPE